VSDTSDDDNNFEDDSTVTDLPAEGAIGFIKTGSFSDENGDGFAQVGETIGYTFTVENTGDVTISGITISDDLLGITALAVVPSTLAPGETGTVTASYTLTQGDIDTGSVTNTAIATGSDPDGNPVSDTSDDNSNLEDDATVTDISVHTSFSLEKSAVLNDEDLDGIPEVGETITYSFRVVNTGNSTLYDIIIEDPIVTVQGGPIDLKKGEEDSTTFKAIYTITERDVEEGSVTNQALVSGVDIEGTIFEDLSDDPNDPTNYDENGDGDPDDPTVVQFQGVLPIADIVIHNVMTPNGDGLNDIFMIEHIENFPNNTVQLFNRWGVEIYNSTGYNPKIDNVFKGFSDGRATVRRGDRLPTGTYFYVVSYERSEGDNKKLSGFLYIN
ncbi:MAG: gliding motility-associated C-terminal domain-containing protein, partial [Leeuwenhoekiella sp.]